MVTMRIISISRLKDFWRNDPTAQRPLRRWYEVVKESKWINLAEVRKTFPHADPVRLKSGNTVTVFNAVGNRFRIITAIHYDRRRVFVLRVLTHAEYDRRGWEGEL